MKYLRHVRRLALIAMTFLALSALPCAAQTRKKVTVGNAPAFLKALAPNMEIILKPGIFTLDSKDALKLKGKHFRWEQSGTGKRLVLFGLENTLIRGQDTEAASMISASSAEGPILAFEECGRVELSALNFQAEGEMGVGPVLEMNRCFDMILSQILVMGKRPFGLGINDSGTLSFMNSTFTGLEIGALVISGSENLEFTDCRFAEGGASPLIRSWDNLELDFNTCSFVDNEGNQLVELSGDPFEMRFSGCSFEGNALAMIAPDEEFPVFMDCVMDGEPFSTETGMVEDQAQESPETAWYFHQASGLAFPYPGSWQIQEEDEKVAFMDSWNGTVVFFLKAEDLPQDLDPWTAPDAAFDAASASFTSIISREMELELQLAPWGASVSTDYLPAREYRGTVSGNGLSLPVRMRTISANESIWGLITFAQVEDSIAGGSQVDQFYLGVDYMPRGE